MKKLIILAIFATALIFVVPGRLAVAQSTSIATFACIAATSPATNCPDGSTPLRNYGYTGAPTYGYVSVSGWRQAGDGGGGEFYLLGPASSKCTPYLGSYSLSPSSTAITGMTTGTGTAGIIVGELISGAGIQPGAEVASITSGSSITMTLPATGSNSGNLQISSDNGGTLIVDSETTPQCYQKAHYRGDPHEFGAFGDAALGGALAHDDTIAMQSWLGAYGNVSNSFVAANTAPPNFGPWTASLPGTYLVSQPLSCPANATIQGPTSQFNPIFQIVASPSFSGLLPGSITQAVMGANTSCRLSGVAITASQPLQGPGTTMNMSTTICVKPPTTPIEVGNYVTDTGPSSGLGPYILPNTTVTSTSGSSCSGTYSYTVTISNAATGTTTTSSPDTISFSSPILLSGTVSSSSPTWITSLSSALGGVNLGNVVTDSYGWVKSPTVAMGDTPTTVSGICSGGGPCIGAGTPCTPTPCVVISQGTTVTGSSTDSLTFWGPDAVDVLGGHVTIDGFSALSGGMHNLDCGDNGGAGTLQLKDTLLQFSTSDNVYIPNCMDARLIGDHVSGAGQNVGAGSTARGVYFGGNDLILADGVIDGSEGEGLAIGDPILGGARDVSVNAMDIATNGVGAVGGHGVYIRNSTGVTICGNHFVQNDAALSGIIAQIYFDGTTSQNINFCGNFYRPSTFHMTPVPQYVYDASSSAAFLGPVSFYENPPIQTLGVLSPNAAAVLAPTQVLPATRAYLTGFVLSNDATSPSDTVDIAGGSATDSTGVAVISNLACNVDLSNSGLNGLDTTSTYAASTTYFFFVVADLAPLTSPETSPSCIASTNPSPNISTSTYGHPIWRLVGALYTTGGSHVVSFTQDGDTFYLATSVPDIRTGGSPICSVGTLSGTSCALSVPCGRSVATCPSMTPPAFAVEAFGRLVGGWGATGASQLLISSLDQSDQSPMNFPLTPGYTNAGSGATPPATPPVFPFHLSTDGAGKVRVRASTTNITAYEITDGWVWHRQQ